MGKSSHFFGQSVFGQQIRMLDAFIQTNSLFQQFLFARLNCEIPLSKCYLFLFGITILSNEITGVSGEHNILNNALSPFTQFDHFGGVNEMI